MGAGAVGVEELVLLTGRRILLGLSNSVLVAFHWSWMGDVGVGAIRVGVVGIGTLCFSRRVLVQE